MTSAFLAIAIMLNTVFAGSAVSAAEGGKTDSLLSGNASETVKCEQNKVSFGFKSAKAMFDSMKSVCSSSGYEMRFDTKSAAVALLDKSSGAIYTTNPYAASNDELAVGDIEKDLESQVSVTYVDINSREKKLQMFSSADCVELGQYSYTTYENGIKVSMTIGKESANQVVPVALTEERFDELTAKMDDLAKEKMSFFYTLYSIKDETDDDVKKEMLEKYPTLSKQNLYIVTELSEREKKQVDENLTSAGYTLAQMKADLKAMNAKNAETSTPSFSLDIEYVLTNDGITVNIPNSLIKFDKESYQLLGINLLSYFGADTAVKGKDGYLFLPDGSGAVIDFNNQDENRRHIITSSVYGFNAADEQTTSGTEGMQTYLPVFGIRRNDNSAFAAIITSGDAVSSITAKLGEPNSNYFTVYNTFAYASDKQVEMDSKVSSLGSKNTVYLYQKTGCTDNFTINYHTLSGNNANYSGMAQAYRKYLLQNGLAETNGTTNTFLNIDTIGSSLYESSFLGFDYKAQAQYTKYEQNIDIANYFIDKGISNISMTLTGWQKYGLDSMISNKVRYSGALGGQSKFLDMLKAAKEKNISVYPDTDMLFVTQDRWFDGFSKNSDSVRQLDYTLGGVSDYDFSIQQYKSMRYALSPSRYENVFSDYFNSFSNIGNKTISMKSVGTYLNSNFSNKDEVNREQSLKTIQTQLKKYTADYKMSFEGANAYVIPYADKLQSIPTTCSQFLGESYSVPFLQIVLSGCVSYCSEPVNLNEDDKTLILQCIETGTSPNYLVAASNVQLLKNTDYNKYYAVNYEVLKDSIAENYKYISDALKNVSGSTLVSHERVADKVFCSTYSNGTKIYVNYSENDYTNGKITVKPMAYLAV